MTRKATLLTIIGLLALAAAVWAGGGFGLRTNLKSAALIDFSTLQPGEIVTVAGGAPLEPGQNPLQAALLGLCGVAVDSHDGAVYFSDTARHVVGRVSPLGDSVRVWAGTGYAAFNGDGKAGSETSLHVPCQLAIHPRTREVYIADTHNYRIRAVSADGTSVRTVAGAGVKGVPDPDLPTEAPLGPGLAFGRFSGDGGPAAEAELNLPAGVALDRQGNIYIGDSGNHRIRVVNTQDQVIQVANVEIEPGAIRTVAGNGSFGFEGDGGPAVKARLAYPKNLAVDADGNIIVSDSLNGRLRWIGGKSGIIRTLAKSIPQANPLNMIGISGVAFDHRGHVYYSDLNGHSIFRVDPSSHSRTLIAGLGPSGFSEDGTSATRARLSAPAALAMSGRGELHFVEVANNRLRKLVDGRLKTVAGGGSPGENVPAAEASFSVLAPLAVNQRGDLFVGDANLHSVRRIDAQTGLISTFAGTGQAGFPALGEPLKQTQLVEPAIAFLGDDPDSFYLKDPAAGIIRRVVRNDEGKWVLEHFAGTGKFGRGGDGGPATEAEFSVPLGMAKHPETGEVYISTVWMPTIRKIDDMGTISTVAGSGQEGYGGDGGPAMEAKFHWMTTILFDSQGNLYVVDFFNNRIRVISRDGNIRTFAGTGEKGFNGDGLPAAETQLNNPNDMAMDAEGNIYVTDVNNHRIRKIEAEPPHRISTIAGTGQRGFSGDGGPATEAQLNVPRAVVLSSDGKILYFTDSFNGRIRAVRLQ